MRMEIDSKGNLPMPMPGTTDSPGRMPKKLIVLCDGTGQDSWGSVAKNPTNITRMARALSPNGWEWDKDNKKWVQWEQIVAYYPGIGTFEGNTTFGVMFGTGLSEIVRAAYGFLANNWQEGDKIYIFGFSRGAYVARSVAGLVADHGLLTKRGMDNFHAVYDTFYKYKDDETHKDPVHSEEPEPAIPSGRRRLPQANFKGAKEVPTDPINGKDKYISKVDAGLRPVPAGTVEVLGVFDTVAFHNVITDPLNRWLAFQVFEAADRPEFENNELSTRVKYVYHALSLDESRIPFQTTLFFLPKEYRSKDKKHNQDWDTELKQVWFSGAHSDIGGGMQDSRLSNITLGWIVSELEAKNLLTFNKDYLTDPDPLPEPLSANFPHWATLKGENKEVFMSKSTNLSRVFAMIGYGLTDYIGWGFLEGLKWVVVHFLYLLPGDTGRIMSGVRIPGEYVPIHDSKRDPGAKDQFLTMEYLHESINDRLLDLKTDIPESEIPESEPKQKWPCNALKGVTKKDNIWEKPVDYRNIWHSMGRWVGRKEGTVPIPVLKDQKVQKIEEIFKNRMRFEVCTKPWLACKVPAEKMAVSVVEQLYQD